MKLCPECLTPLNRRIHKIFECWECPEGHGSLYPKGELEKIIHSLTGLGSPELKLWDNRESYVAVRSHLISPDGDRALVEIRDKEKPSIMVYGDPETHSLWVHTGEEEKLLEHVRAAAKIDSVGAYAALAAEEAIKVFEGREPLPETAGHLLIALKLLGERVARAMPNITF